VLDPDLKKHNPDAEVLGGNKVCFCSSILWFP
jgi:hypothetical protein